SKSFVYLLAPAGQRLAMERGWLPRLRTRRPLVPGTLFVAHALQVAELHNLLIEADRSGRIELLELVSEPACWRSWGNSTLKPDSYVRLGIGEFEDSYFIEVDMGTEGSWALERKLRQYVEYQATGQEQAERGVFPKVLWTAPDGQRVAAIEDCVQRLPCSAWELFMVACFREVPALFDQQGGLPSHEKMEAANSSSR
ncbi:MAG: replication-relaxation family protein, partial [Solirubrobacterales bacterium]